MGVTGGESENGAKSARPFRVDLSQEDFDREFFGLILRHSEANTDVVKRQAELLARNGDYENALRLDQLLTERQPEDPIAHYNLACSLSMSGQLQLAVIALARAIELGYRDLRISWRIRILTRCVSCPASVSSCDVAFPTTNLH